MTSVKRRKKRKLPIHVYLIYMIVASLLFTAVTFSSYVSTSEGGDSVSIALFANDTEILIPVDKCEPGESFTMNVKVTNYEDDRVCEVSQAYTITAEAVTGRIPLELEWIGEQPIGDFHLLDGREQYAEYQLKVSWPVENGNYPSGDYSNEIEVIRILAECNQID